MNKLLLSLCFVVFGLTLLGQDRARVIIDVPSTQKPWNNLEWNKSPSQFQFAIVTDRTGGHRPGVFLKGIQKLNLLQPEFVMSVGDLIEGYTEDTDQLDEEWKEFNGFIDSLTVPFFYVPGNHDITNEVMEKKWKEIFGVTHYHFVYNDVLFLCLNSEDNYRGAGRGTIDDKQFEYIKKTLEENTDVKWTLVFLHQPLWVQEDTKRWKDVEDLLSGRNHNVFAGHYHRYWKTSRNNGNYIALATTGGSNRLRGTAYGEFDHVVWVTMTDQGPILANLLLEGIWDENVVTEDLVDLVRNEPYPVRIEPVYVDERGSDKWSTEVRVTNNSDYKMKVELTGVAHADWFHSLEKTSFEVEPNDVVQFNLSAESQVTKPSGNPIFIKSSVTYEYPNRPDIVLNNSLKILPFPKYEVNVVDGRIKVDGKLNEWDDAEWLTIDADSFSGSPFNYEGPDDFSLSFSQKVNENNLYLAFKIQDSDIYTSEKGSLWSQDALVIGLDGRSLGKSAFNLGEGRGRDWLAYLRTFKNDSPVYNEKALPDGVISKVNEIEGGMNVEMVIPIQLITAQQGENWSSYRLGVGYYDLDEGGQKRTEHFWYPAWNAVSDIPGSGMIFRK